MVARKTAAQKAADVKAAETPAVDEKPAGEEQSTGDATSTPPVTPAAETPAKVDSKPATAKESKPEGKPAAKRKRYVVTGAVAVVRTTDGSERYLYRNAPVDPDAFDADSIKHVVSLGLVAEVK